MKVDAFGADSDPIATARRAYQASLKLGLIKGADRSHAVEVMAQALKRSFDDILEANTLDLEASREMAVPELILDWLKLTPERLQTTVDILQRLGELSDPLRRVRNAEYQLADSQTYWQLMPLGVIALIYRRSRSWERLRQGYVLKPATA